MTTQTKIEALAAHLACDADEINPCKYSNNEFFHGAREYLVLTDEEAHERCVEHIKDTLWAFSASFIASHTRNGLSTECIKALEKMQGELCESALPIIEALIEDLDHFARDAMSSDGRGHFISSYDGKEFECGQYFVYRTN
jgi:hypothetical protein